MHDRKLIRLTGFDYSSSRYYFFTICVENHHQSFGSHQGNIAFEQWEIQLNHTIKSIPKIKPLPELIGAYKTTVSKRIHEAGDKMFKWQKSYHDHIIRNTRSLNIIKKYIRKNPEKWEL